MADYNSIGNHSNDIEPAMGPSELSKFSPGLLTFAAIVTGCIMLTGLFGNLLTVIALLKCPKVRNVAAAFIISLCIADFLFCVMVLPFAISGFWTRTWSHGGVLCKLVPFLRYGNVGVSLLSIALITLNRYIMIAHHSWYARVYRKQNIALMIVFSWMFSYGMQIPTLVGVWGKFDYDPDLGTCSIIPDDKGRTSKTALFVIAFIVPALLIFICYARIFWVVHSSERRMREHQRSQHASPGTLNNSTTDKRSTIKDNRETKAKRNEWRITKMVLAIFLSFLVCYLPITIAKVADSHVQYPIFHIAGYLLLYASACVNPIIYVIMNAQYRAAYAAALCCPLSRLPGLTSGAYPSSPVACQPKKIRYTSEMERASRVQLQQHTNGAQPSVTGRVESRPTGSPGPGRQIGPKPIGNGSNALASSKSGPVKNGGTNSPSKPAAGKQDPKTGSLRPVGSKTDSRNNSQFSDSQRNGTKIGSRQNVGEKNTRFQIVHYDQNGITRIYT
ncbi:G-protein coupled receptor moody-like [Achroia grisella]|uniref:G-protein coupled receptor moody-like n=1 Tax=Achroia grisella TaxID=688607 RepID=UPI0027D2C905|nr:G-protein coupled receptor moody-like [Achroia grisella]